MRCLYVYTQDLLIEERQSRGKELAEIFESLFFEPVHGDPFGYEYLDGLRGTIHARGTDHCRGKAIDVKTGFILTEPDYKAASNGTVVDFFSLEMSKPQLYQSIVSHMASR